MAYLPDSQREVLTMLKVLGLTVEEVARATGSTTGAVKQKAHRAYEKLRGILEAREAPAAGTAERRLARGASARMLTFRCGPARL